MKDTSRLNDVKRKGAGRVGLELVALVVRGFGAVLLLLLGTIQWALPRLGRKLRPFKKWLMRRLRRQWQRNPLCSLLVVIVAVPLLALVGLNGLVRLSGGDPALLATDHIRDKSFAVGRLALHLPFHIFSSCRSSKDQMIEASAKTHGVPVRLVRAVAFTESNYRSHVISHAGAMGVMQLMPGTAKDLGVQDPFDAQENIDGGARYLGQLHRRYRGNIRRIAAAYHAGPGAVPKRGPLRVGSTTRNYMRLVYRRATGREKFRAASD